MTAYTDLFYSSLYTAAPSSVVSRSQKSVYADSLDGDDANTGNTLGDAKETLQAALDQLPNIVQEDVTVFVAGEFTDGAVDKGTVGAGTVFISADLAPYAVVSGEDYGTAGAGTTPTALVKPTGADDWTAADLVGAIVRITAGAANGSESLVVSNTTTTATIFPISGLDDTSEFELLTPAASVETLTLEKCYSKIHVEGLVIDASVVSLCADVQFENCEFLVADVSGSLRVNDCLNVSFVNCHFSDSASALLRDLQRATFTRCLIKDGQLDVRRCQHVSGTVYAADCTAAALNISECTLAEIGMTANDNDVTPLVLSSCALFRAGSGGIVGTGNSQYGVDISDGGRYDLTGATLTGTSGDFTIEGVAETWSQLAAHSAVMHDTTIVVVS